MQPQEHSRSAHPTQETGGTEWRLLKEAQSREQMLWIRSFLWRYGMAASCVGAAFAVRYALTPQIGTESPFMVFAPAALLAARIGGFGPGMAALAAGLALGDYYFSPPIYRWGPYREPEVILILTYAITTAVGVVLFERLAYSKRQVELAARTAQAAIEDAQRRRAELENEVAERKRAERDLQNTQAELSQYADELEERVAERTAKLQESLQSLESVLYHVAHDLRAPLRAMHGFTTLLVNESGQPLNPAGVDYARRVSESARQMDELLQELLNYGHACHVELIPARVALGDVIAAVLYKYRDELQSRNASMNVQRPLPSVWADKHSLEDILVNLLSNALKFTPAERAPHVEIAAEERNSHVRVWVKDQGIGIARQHQGRIFRVFERLDPTRTYPGTGIGLAIVQKLAQRMGGSVGVDSIYGKGSQFWVDLPAAPKRPK